MMVVWISDLELSVSVRTYDIKHLNIQYIYTETLKSVFKNSAAPGFFHPLPGVWILMKVMLCVTFNASMLLLFQFINSAFSDYNKDQFTPVKLEGTDEQVSRGNHKVLLFFQCCCLRKFFGSPLGSKKKKKRQQPCRLVFVSPEVRESSRLWVFKVIFDTTSNHIFNVGSLVSIVV